MNLRRCVQCGSWSDADRFPACPVCGGNSVPWAFDPGAPPPGQAEHEARRDNRWSHLAIPAGILLTLGGIFRALTGPSELMVPLGGLVLLSLAILAAWGAGARTARHPGHAPPVVLEPVRSAVGKAASSALVTIAVTIAGLALVAGIVLVVLFVACITAIKP